MAPRPLTAQMSMNLCQRPTRMSSKSSTLTPWAFSNRSLSFVMRSLMLLSVPASMAADGQDQQWVNNVDRTWSCLRSPHFAKRDGGVGGLRMVLLDMQKGAKRGIRDVRRGGCDRA
jgi:hypothetical protein